MKRGFSLVELSIVLVILGLLVGGILVGKSLIRASELRAIGTEYNRWQTAVSAFRDKYFAIPGDMANAKSFWGAAAVCPGNSNQGSTDAATCNGNGNGLIEDSPAGASSNEYFRFWQHLSNAGLIEGRYSGVRGPGGNNHSVGGANSPASKVTGGCWTAKANETAVTSGVSFRQPVGNKYSMGHGATAGSCVDPLFVPAELWNIDQKIDDGKPGTGRILAYPWNNCTNAANGADFNSDYNLEPTEVLCAFQSMTRW